METKARDAKALDKIKTFVSENDLSIAFVTDRVAFKMRDLIRQVRKNYWGVFDDPTDPMTGREKIWVPLTESMVEATVKNTDIDTKDINLRAKKPEAIGLTSILRAEVRNQLDYIDFGELLDNHNRSKAINGTGIWKTIKDWDEKEKKWRPCVYEVDRLNLYISAMAGNMQEDDFAERVIMTPEQVMNMDGWENTKNITGTLNLHPNDKDLGPFSGEQASSRRVEIFEYWGWFSKDLLTLETEDKDEQVFGHMVASGVFSNEQKRIHLVEAVKGWKPYEEDWFIKVPGRWDGRGVGEKLIMLQLWMNVVVNIRINRNNIAQLGLFKVKKGRGITAQMLKRLGSNGAILVEDIDDIQQFVMQEAGPSSYNDENVIKAWSERTTQAFEVATGEALPSSTPATNAVIQNTNAQSAFTLLKESTGLFIQRWMKRHFIPIIQKNLTPKNIVRLTGDPEELRELDERIVNEILYEELDRLNKEGKVVDPMQVQSERDRAMAKLSSMGKDRYVELLNKVDLTEYDVQVFVTNEEIDKAVIIKNLLDILKIAPAVPGLDIDPATIVTQAIDMMGLSTYQLRRRQNIASSIPGQPSPTEPVMPQGQGQIPPGAGMTPPGMAASNAQKIYQGANVPTLRTQV